MKNNIKINNSMRVLALLCIIALGIAGTTSSCGKFAPCFDKDLYEANKDKACQMDCPGVTGCDGKKYCNECIANQQGIRVKK